MEEQQMLTVETVEKYLADPESVDLSGFTEIENSAAEMLADYRGALCLSGLASLSEECARSLGSHKGSLELSGISQLSNKALSHLARHNGEIDLQGLKQLDTDGATIISKSLSRIIVEDYEFSEEVQATLRVYPELRDASGELEEWLLSELGYESENQGDDWLAEQTKEALKEAADHSYSWDPEDKEWFGSSSRAGDSAPFHDGFDLVRNAWRREIHSVSLYDQDRTYLVFFGAIEEIQSDLSQCLKKLSEED